ncbi:hypothetical protein LINGRAHAP2_LOCUS30550 [Linum grandiflorum]
MRFLRTSGKFCAQLCTPFKKALLIQLLGKGVGIQYLYNRLKALWRAEGRLQMADLEDEIFLASFDNPLDYDRALTGGPWLILDHYLVVHSCDPSFRASSNFPPKIVIWIRFPQLPYQYYHEDVLKGLGNLVGRTIRLHDRMLTSTRGKFAWLAVEINLHEPVASSDFLDDVWQDVEFENFPTLSFECGLVRHEAAACPSNQGNFPKSKLLPVGFGFIPSDRQMVLTANGPPPKRPVLGPWLTVVCNSCKHKKGNLPQQLVSAGLGGSFAVKNSKPTDHVVKGKEKETVMPSSITSCHTVVSINDGVFVGFVNENGEVSKECKSRSRQRRGKANVAKENEKEGITIKMKDQSSKKSLGPLNNTNGHVQLTSLTQHDPNGPVLLISRESDPLIIRDQSSPCMNQSTWPKPVTHEAAPDLSVVLFNEVLAEPTITNGTPSLSYLGDTMTHHCFHQGSVSKKKSSSAQQALCDISSLSNKPHS